MSNPRFYHLYATFRGPSPHWQYHGHARVRGTFRDSDGHLVPPLPNWRVQALSVKQACAFVHESVTSASRTDALGVWSWPKFVWDAHCQQNDTRGAQ